MPESLVVVSSSKLSLIAMNFSISFSTKEIMLVKVSKLEAHALVVTFFLEIVMVSTSGLL